MTHNINIAMCPCCNTYMSKAKNTQGEPEPRPGDFSICAHCAAILVFQKVGEFLNYRVAKDGDIDEAINDGLYAHLLAARDFILSGKHGYRNSKKQELN